ncbi:MAG: sialate O-acetylesterase [Planctomycetota bacterium]
MAISARAIAPTVALLASFAGAAPAPAELALDPLFRDHAVLQRLRPVPVEGRAAPNAAVEVEFAGRKASGTAGADGRFAVALPAMPHSAEPATLVVRSGGQEVRVADVLVGEVWFCSGQSNMEWTVDASNDAARAREIAPLRPIRSFKAPHLTSSSPRDSVPGEWRAASPQTVGSFTAVGFWFGSRLAESLEVPVGLVDISWGGTRIEPWIPLDAMQRSSFKDRADALAAQIAEHARVKPEDRAAAAAAEADRYRAACDAYWSAAIKGEAAGGAQAIPGPDFPSGFSKCRLPAYYPALDPALGGFDGFVWFTREFDVPAEMAGKPLVLQLPAIDDCDLTTIDGATVGSTVANWNSPRIYAMPDGLSAGRHRIVIAVLDMSGQGGFAAGDMRLELASGDASLDLAGAWLWRRGGGVPQAAVPMRRDVNKEPGTEPHEPAAIWNAMMAPCVRFPARGVIWYHG